MHLDDDDSNFVAKAVLTYQTNTVYKYNDTGAQNSDMDLRHELATFPIYTALISKLIRIHPTITAHTIFPVVFIPMAYMVYYLITDCLFQDKKKVYTFLILLSFIYIFGFYSVYTNFCFLLYRVWQGKSILANIAIPLLWLLYFAYNKEKKNNIYWFAIFITCAGANLLTSMAVSLIPVELFCLSIAYWINKKNILLLKNFLLRNLVGIK